MNIMSLDVLGVSLGRRYRCSGGGTVFSILRRKFFWGGLAKVSSAGQRAFGGVWGRGRRTKVESLPGEKRYSRQRQLKWPENPVWAPSIQ